MTKGKKTASMIKRLRSSREQRGVVSGSSSSDSDQVEGEVVREVMGTAEVPPVGIGAGEVEDLPSGAVPERRRGDRPVAVEEVVLGVGGPIEGATEGVGAEGISEDVRALLDALVGMLDREATEARAEEEESRAMGAFAEFISGAGRVEGTGEVRDEAEEVEGMGTGAAEAGVGVEAEAEEAVFEEDEEEGDDDGMDDPDEAEVGALGSTRAVACWAYKFNHGGMCHFINIWFDPWLNGRGLKEALGWELLTWGSPHQTPLSVLINNGKWTKPSQWNPTLEALWDEITQLDVGGIGDDILIGLTVAQRVLTTWRSNVPSPDSSVPLKSITTPEILQIAQAFKVNIIETPLIPSSRSPPVGGMENYTYSEKEIPRRTFLPLGANHGVRTSSSPIRPGCNSKKHWKLTKLEQPSLENNSDVACVMQ
ncbi:hypothetical protein QJS10_CPA08g00569 [Acorus calamus]|uniref:Uncharacterized protein n=1 Tax=Acorus calamus TaxID=4465 RepID=A0AAV9EC25_ACOCL|nr:hypothetical protein QJS10_CPA08g00569 [Acorus calamus]